VSATGEDRRAPRYLSRARASMARCWFAFVRAAAAARRIHRHPDHGAAASRRSRRATIRRRSISRRCSGAPRSSPTARNRRACGRDVLCRAFIYGARTPSPSVCPFTVAASARAGVTSLFRRKNRFSSSSVVDIMCPFPIIILALVVVPCSQRASLASSQSIAPYAVTIGERSPASALVGAVEPRVPYINAAAAQRLQPTPHHFVNMGEHSRRPISFMLTASCPGVHP